MMAMQDLTQADFDLERMFDMLDEALTSRDPRVQSALRSLLTIVALTHPQETGDMAIETSHGPLRQLKEDLRNLSRRVTEVERELRARPPYTPPGATPPQSPYTNPGSPYGNGPWWGVTPPGPPPTAWSTSSTGVGLTDDDGRVKLTDINSTK